MVATGFDVKRSTTVRSSLSWLVTNASSARAPAPRKADEHRHQRNRAHDQVPLSIFFFSASRPAR